MGFNIYIMLTEKDEINMVIGNGFALSLYRFMNLMDMAEQGLAVVRDNRKKSETVLVVNMEINQAWTLYDRQDSQPWPDHVLEFIARNLLYFDLCHEDQVAFVNMLEMKGTYYLSGEGPDITDGVDTYRAGTIWTAEPENGPPPHLGLMFGEYVGWHDSEESAIEAIRDKFYAPIDDDYF